MGKRKFYLNIVTALSLITTDEIMLSGTSYFRDIMKTKTRYATKALAKCHPREQVCPLT